MRHRYALATLVLAALTISPAHAQYMRIDGIEGESTAQGYEKWIDIVSFEHALTVAVQSGRVNSAPVHTPIVIGKSLDVATVRLIEALNKGVRISEVELAFVRPGEDRFEYLRIELKNVYLTRHAMSLLGINGNTEETALVYEEITWTYTPQGPDGRPGPPVTTTYNVATNTSNVATLSVFEAEPDGDAVVFRWETNGERGIYGFELQQRATGGFMRASYVPGAGWSSKNLEYELRVRGLEKGIHTFRLAVLGVDGTVAYSDELEVAVGVPAGVDVVVDAPYPNPFSRQMQVAVAVAQPREARIAVSDLLGREVAVLFDGWLEPGGQQRFAFTPGATLAAGLYAVRVVSGGTSTTRLVTYAR